MIWSRADRNGYIGKVETNVKLSRKNEKCLRSIPGNLVKTYEILSGFPQKTTAYIKHKKIL